MKRQYLTAVLTWACLAIFWTNAYGVYLSFEEFKQERMAALRTTDEELRSLYKRQIQARYAVHYSDGDAREALFSAPGDPANTGYLVKALEKAYAQEPKDWATIASVLEVAVMGTDEESIIHLCIEILQNVRKIPDDGTDVVHGAAQYLLLKRKMQHVDVVIKCVYADHVGVEDDNRPLHTVEEWRAGRNGLRTCAMGTLLSFLPAGQPLLEIFERLCRDHPVEGTEPSSWRRSIAGQLIEMKKGIEIELNGNVDKGERGTRVR